MINLILAIACSLLCGLCYVKMIVQIKSVKDGFFTIGGIVIASILPATMWYFYSQIN